MEYPSCIVKELPAHEQVPAMERAIDINPLNRPSPKKIIDLIRVIMPALVVDESVLQPQHIAVMRGKLWPSNGAELSVSFPFDGTPQNVQEKIVAVANRWNKYCNIKFRLTNDPKANIRIARVNDGYWSYVGTDILHIPFNQPTMNLQGFTINTPDSEYLRVVQHEFFHSAGGVHEHMRQELVNRLDVAKTIAWGRQVLGWDEQTVRQQILTPISEESIRGTPHADQDSIMSYQLPSSITKDGQPIRGGVDIDALDGEYAGKIYPLEITPPEPPKPPPPKPPTGGVDVMAIFLKLIALYKAIQAKDWTTAWSIIMELIGLISSATPEQHAEAQAMFTAFEKQNAPKPK